MIDIRTLKIIIIKARYEQLEEILVDEELPAIERLRENEQMMKELEKVADKTGQIEVSSLIFGLCFVFCSLRNLYSDVCDEILYKLKEKKALEWISGRYGSLLIWN